MSLALNVSTVQLYKQNADKLIHIINDWFISLVDRYMNAHYGGKKKDLLHGHPETVVEIGAGYGANFRYLKPKTKLIVIEPNESYNDILQRRARKFNIDITILNTGAEFIDIPSGSVEMVFGSLVLCTVKKPEQVLSEIHRILRKEGKYIFIEHVKAEQHSWICRVQNLVKQPWKWFFDGCNVARDTGGSIKNIPFQKVNMNEFNSKTLFLPIIPHICGIAVK